MKTDVSTYGDMFKEVKGDGLSFKIVIRNGDTGEDWFEDLSAIESVDFIDRQIAKIEKWVRKSVEQISDFVKGLFNPDYELSEG